MGNILTKLFGKRGETSSADAQQKTEEKNFEILKYDGLRAARMGNFGQAVRCLEHASALKPDEVVLQTLGELYIRKEDFPEAVRCLQQAVALDPVTDRPYQTLLHTYYMMENYASMIALQPQIAARGTESAQCSYWLAHAYLRLSQMESAEAEALKAVQESEDAADARLLLARIRYEGGQTAAALDALHELLEQSPGHEQALLLLAEIRQAQQPSQAAEIYQQLLAQNPFCREACLALARLWHVQGDTTKALSLLDESVEVIDGFAEGYLLRGELRAAMGDEAGAAADRDEAAHCSGHAAESANVTQNMSAGGSNTFGGMPV